MSELVIAAAILMLPFVALHKPATGAFEHKSSNGPMGPWEKTEGPPGLTVTVIYKANNIVYAGTETQGIYRSTDGGLSWSAANNGIERASISDIIVSGPNLLAAAKSSCPIYLNIFKSQIMERLGAERSG